MRLEGNPNTKQAKGAKGEAPAKTAGRRRGDKGGHEKAHKSQKGQIVLSANLANLRKSRAYRRRCAFEMQRRGGAGMAGGVV